MQAKALIMHSKSIKPYILRTSRFITGWLQGRTGLMALTVLASLLWFVIDWCSDTTYRPLSDWLLYFVNATAALILLAPWIFTRRIWLQAAVIVILDIVLEANLMYNRTYLTAIPASSYSLAGNMADFTTSIFESFRLKDAVFALILITGTSLSYRIRFKSVPRLWLRWLSMLGISACISAAGIAVRGGFYAAYDKLVQSCYYFTCGTPTYTVAGHALYTWLDGRQQSTMTPADSAMIMQWLANQKEFAAAAETDGSRKSLVLIICESLESWPLEAEIDGKPIAPYLRSLINDSSTFYAPNMLTQVAAGHSIDAQLLYTAGMLPTINSVYSMKYPASTYPSLNKELRADRNSRSILMTSDKIITWNQGTIARSFGYDTIVARDKWMMDETISKKLSDGSFLRQAADELVKGDMWPEGNNGMLTVITYSGHFPFKINKELLDKNFDISNAKLPERVRDYAEAVHYVDAQLPRIIDYLKGRTDYNDILIVITGDHEALGLDRKSLRDFSPESSRLVSESKFTPLIVLNAPSGGRYEGVFGQIDFYPTMLDMLGLTDASWRGMGKSILAADKVPAAFTSVPVELAGDTTGCDPAVIEHIKGARRVSDAIIVHDLLRKE